MHQIPVGKGCLTGHKSDFEVDHPLQSMAESICHLVSDMLRYTYSLDETKEVRMGRANLGQVLRRSLDGTRSVAPLATTVS